MFKENRFTFRKKPKQSPSREEIGPDRGEFKEAQKVADKYEEKRQERLENDKRRRAILTEIGHLEEKIKELGGGHEALIKSAPYFQKIQKLRSEIEKIDFMERIEYSDEVFNDYTQRLGSLISTRMRELNKRDQGFVGVLGDFDPDRLGSNLLEGAEERYNEILMKLSRYLYTATWNSHGRYGKYRKNLYRRIRDFNAFAHMLAENLVVEFFKDKDSIGDLDLYHVVVEDDVVKTYENFVKLFDAVDQIVYEGEEVPW